VIVWTDLAKRISVPGLAAAITARSVPLEPSSSGLVTVSVLGSQRSSSTSSRKRDMARLRVILGA